MLIFDQLKRNDPQLRALTWTILGCMCVLFVGLYYVQVIASKHFVRDQEAQSFRTVRIPAVRGKILDRLGRAMAENRPSYNVCVYLDELRDRFTFQYINVVKPDYFAAHPLAKGVPRTALADLYRQARYQAVSNIAHQVGLILEEPLQVDPEEFHRHYNEARALPMPIAEGLNTRQLACFQEQPNPALGVDLDVQPLRSYPQGEAVAHILGYLKRDTRSTVGEDAFVNYRLPDFSGEIGIERAYDSQLRGRGGVKSVLVNSLGYRQSETVWTPAEPGHNVVLTINLDVQLAACAALNAVDRRLLREGTTEIKGAAVVMDPHSGDLLAVVSVPAYDPNQFIPSISSADYQLLNDEDRKPLFNRATQGNYPPGSIFKIITGLACLENGLDPKRKFYNPGHIWVGKRPINDLAEPGEYDFQKAFVKSSNTYFITNGLAAGPEAIVQIGESLHLGERTGLPTGQEVGGHFPSREQVGQRRWYDGDTANLCIGQGPVDLTLIQAAVLVAAIANGGKVLEPRLVMRVEPQDPQSDEEPVILPSGAVRNNLGVRPSSLEVTRQAMHADVTEGTGKAAAVPGMMAAGKTGTAEITNGRGIVINHITWFASFAPYENPRYVVVVMVENGRYGGDTCAPVARKIYQALLDLERNIPVQPLTMAQAP